MSTLRNRSSHGSIRRLRNRMQALTEKLRRPLSLGKLTPLAGSTRSLDRSPIHDGGATIVPDALEIAAVLRKRLAVVSGGEDKRGGLVLSIFAPQDLVESDLRQTLLYLRSLLGPEEREVGVSIVVENSPHVQHHLQCILQAIQSILGTECVHAVYLPLAQGFWDKRRLQSSPSSSSIAACSLPLHYVTPQKLFKTISPLQLTAEFGGALEYDHQLWLERQLAVERFVRDARVLRKHAESSVAAAQSKMAAWEDLEGNADLAMEDLQSHCTAVQQRIDDTLAQGQRLIDALQNDPGCASQFGKGTPKEKANIHRKIKQAMDTVLLIKHRFASRWQELYRVLSQISQLQTFNREADQVVEWVRTEGERLLSNCSLGANTDEALVNRKHIQQVALLTMQTYARYSQLKNLANQILRDIECSKADVTIVHQKLSKLDHACQSFASKVEVHRKIAEIAILFHQTAEHLLKLLTDVERRVTINPLPGTNTIHISSSSSTGASSSSSTSSEGDGNTSSPSSLTLLQTPSPTLSADRPHLMHCSKSTTSLSLTPSPLLHIQSGIVANRGVVGGGNNTFLGISKMGGSLLSLVDQDSKSGSQLTLSHAPSSPLTSESSGIGGSTTTVDYQQQQVSSIAATQKLLMELEDTDHLIDSAFDEIRRVVSILATSLQQGGRDMDRYRSDLDTSLALLHKRRDFVKRLMEQRRGWYLKTAQLLSCEEDARQSISWLTELCQVAQSSVEHQRRRTSTNDEDDQEKDTDIKDFEAWKSRHQQMDVTAKDAYDYGRKLLDRAVALRKELCLRTTACNRIADALFSAWLRYVKTSKRHKLLASSGNRNRDFHSCSSLV